jgi:hypothetical protein
VGIGITGSGKRIKSVCDYTGGKEKIENCGQFLK